MRINVGIHQLRDRSAGKQYPAENPECHEKQYQDHKFFCLKKRHPDMMFQHDKPSLCKFFRAKTSGFSSRSPEFQ